MSIGFTQKPYCLLPIFSLGRVFKIRDFLCMNLSDFVVVDRDILTPQ